MSSYPGTYRAQCVSTKGDKITAYVPQVFGDVRITITSRTGGLPAANSNGWVMFESAMASLPVWLSGTGSAGSPSGGTASFGTLPASSVTIPSDDDATQYIQSLINALISGSGHTFPAITNQLEVNHGLLGVFMAVSEASGGKEGNALWEGITYPTNEVVDITTDYWNGPPGTTYSNVFFSFQFGWDVDATAVEFSLDGIDLIHQAIPPLQANEAELAAKHMVRSFVMIMPSSDPDPWSLSVEVTSAAPTVTLTGTTYYTGITGSRSNTPTALYDILHSVGVL